MTRRLFLWLIFLTCAMPGKAGQAAALDLSLAVKALKDHCLTPLINGNDPAISPSNAKLPELDKTQAAQIAPDGARVFGLPGLQGNAVLIARPAGCTVALHRIDPAVFSGALNRGFSDRKKFRLLKEKREDDAKLSKKLFVYDEAWSILVTASDVARPNGIQAMMTVSRAAKSSP